MPPLVAVVVGATSIGTMVHRRLPCVARNGSVLHRHHHHLLVEEASGVEALVCHALSAVLQSSC